MTLLFLFLSLPLWWVVFKMTLPNTSFEMDFDVAHGTFISMLKYYVDCGWAIFVTSLLMAFWSVSHQAARAATPLLAASALYALLFNVWLVVSYETYLHNRYPKGGLQSMATSTYTSNKYALTLALASSAITLFVGGVAAIIYGLEHLR